MNSWKKNEKKQENTEQNGPPPLPTLQSSEQYDRHRELSVVAGVTRIAKEHRGDARAMAKAWGFIVPDIAQRSTIVVPDPIPETFTENNDVFESRETTDADWDNENPSPRSRSPGWQKEPKQNEKKRKFNAEIHNKLYKEAGISDELMVNAINSTRHTERHLKKCRKENSNY